MMNTMHAYSWEVEKQNFANELSDVQMLEYNMQRGLRSKGASNLYLCPQFCEHLVFNHEAGLQGLGASVRFLSSQTIPTQPS